MKLIYSEKARPKNLKIGFDVTEYKFRNQVGDFSNFVAFSENLKFNESSWLLSYKSSLS